MRLHGEDIPRIKADPPLGGKWRGSITTYSTLTLQQRKAESAGDKGRKKGQLRQKHPAARKNECTVESAIMVCCFVTKHDDFVYVNINIFR